MSRAAPVVLIAVGDRSDDCVERIVRERPDWSAFRLDDPFDPASIEYLIGSNPPAGLLARLPRLRAVFAFGAGVDALLRRADLPGALPVVRLLDAGMAEQMVEYALHGVLLWQRRLFDYAAQQRAACWQPWPARLRRDTRVTVLGLGEIGAAVAAELARLGYAVTGWSRRPRRLDTLRCIAGLPELDVALARTDVLIDVLPSTSHTRGLLDRSRLQRLPQGAMVVNCARGDQLDVDALIALLDAGRLGGALLDVFSAEPLPSDSPLWTHPRVVVTPHVAALTLPGPAIGQVVANIERDCAGQSMQGQVERSQAY